MNVINNLLILFLITQSISLDYYMQNWKVKIKSYDKADTVYIECNED
jgi:hypothetical protein